ncbi:hypothetical protein SNEBB_009099 [Seison nebaliae]|nr:hypothetical protein SNEBB_009099 [Seison nebaliae]
MSIKSTWQDRANEEKMDVSFWEPWCSDTDTGSNLTARSKPGGGTFHKKQFKFDSRLIDENCISKYPKNIIEKYPQHDNQGNIVYPNGLIIHQWTHLDRQQYQKTKRQTVVRSENYMIMLAEKNSKILMKSSVIRTIFQQYANLDGILQLREITMPDGFSGACEYLGSLVRKPSRNMSSFRFKKVGKKTQGWEGPFEQCNCFEVKLYFMGEWKSIPIDDLVPIGKDGEKLILMPCDLKELWPILITKAILKILSLSNYEEEKTKYFEAFILELITGWIPEDLPLNSIQFRESANESNYDYEINLKNNTKQLTESSDYQMSKIDEEKVSVEPIPIHTCLESIRKFFVGATPIIFLNVLGIGPKQELYKMYPLIFKYGLARFYEEPKWKTYRSKAILHQSLHEYYCNSNKFSHFYGVVIHPKFPITEYLYTREGKLISHFSNDKMNCFRYLAIADDEKKELVFANDNPAITYSLSILSEISAYQKKCLWKEKIHAELFTEHQLSKLIKEYISKISSIIKEMELAVLGVKPTYIHFSVEKVLIDKLINHLDNFSDNIYLKDAIKLCVQSTIKEDDIPKRALKILNKIDWSELSQDIPKPTDLTQSINWFNQTLLQQESGFLFHRKQFTRYRIIVVEQPNLGKYEMIEPSRNMKRISINPKYYRTSNGCFLPPTFQFPPFFLNRDYVYDYYIVSDCPPEDNCILFRLQSIGKLLEVPNIFSVKKAKSLTAKSRLVRTNINATVALFEIAFSPNHFKSNGILYDKIGGFCRTKIILTKLQTFHQFSIPANKKRLIIHLQIQTPIAACFEIFSNYRLDIGDCANAISYLFQPSCCLKIFYEKLYEIFSSIICNVIRLGYNQGFSLSTLEKSLKDFCAVYAVSDHQKEPLRKKLAKVLGILLLRFVNLKKLPLDWLVDDKKCQETVKQHVCMLRSFLLVDQNIFFNVPEFDPFEEPTLTVQHNNETVKMEKMLTEVRSHLKDNSENLIRLLNYHFIDECCIADIKSKSLPPKFFPLEDIDLFEDPTSNLFSNKYQGVSSILTQQPDSRFDERSPMSRALTKYQILFSVVLFSSFSKKEFTDLIGHYKRLPVRFKQHFFLTYEVQMNEEKFMEKFRNKSKETKLSKYDAITQSEILMETINCYLSIVNNDSGKTLPTSGNRPLPYVYPPNKNGYTLFITFTSNPAICNTSFSFLNCAEVKWTINHFSGIPCLITSEKVRGNLLEFQSRKSEEPIWQADYYGHYSHSSLNLSPVQSFDYNRRNTAEKMRVSFRPIVPHGVPYPILSKDREKVMSTYELSKFYTFPLSNLTETYDMEYMYVEFFKKYCVVENVLIMTKFFTSSRPQPLFVEFHISDCTFPIFLTVFENDKPIVTVEERGSIYIPGLQVRPSTNKKIIEYKIAVQLRTSLGLNQSQNQQLLEKLREEVVENPEPATLNKRIIYKRTSSRMKPHSKIPASPSIGRVQIIKEFKDATKPSRPLDFVLRFMVDKAYRTTLNFADSAHSSSQLTRPFAKKSITKYDKSITLSSTLVSVEHQMLRKLNHILVDCPRTSNLLDTYLTRFAPYISPINAISTLQRNLLKMIKQKKVCGISKNLWVNRRKTELRNREMKLEALKHRTTTYKQSMNDKTTSFTNDIQMILKRQLHYQC